MLATSKATSWKIDASVIPADPCDLDFFMAKFAAVYRIVFGILILNLIQVNDLLLKVHLSLRMQVPLKGYRFHAVTITVILRVGNFQVNFMED